MSYDDAPYAGAVAHHAVPGLFPTFHSAATLLRVARSELRPELIDGGAGTDVIEQFYQLLDEVDAYLTNQTKRRGQRGGSTHAKEFVVEVEGLDGSGKTTLVRRLAEALGPDRAVATKTPSASLANIRPLWDHRGGFLARAFYTVSNYVLAYEIDTCEHRIIVVDRWYASTVAYTVGYCRLADLAGDLFEWPPDLHLKPDVLLVLRIDPDVRQKRVDDRAAAGREGGGASRFNPWDDRLATDPSLGPRILEALHRVQGPREVHSVNANLSVEEVVQEALSIVQPALHKVSHPEQCFATQPLEWWRCMSQQLGLCDQYGKRSHHALWNLQVSYASGGALGGPPVLKTVGLDRIDSSCAYYWTGRSSWQSLIGRRQGNHHGRVLASVLWVGGEYPTESQWRAEGYMTMVTDHECALRGYTAPPSLVAHMTACKGGWSECDDGKRPSRPDEYCDSVKRARTSPDPSDVCMVRFVPVRIEVLRGGPSTRLPGFPQRWEWSRDGKAPGKSCDWTMRPILPFSGIMKPSQPMAFRGMTIAIIGCHGAGKSTICAKLSLLLGCNQDPELGEILRDRSSLMASGHLHGNGSSTNTSEEEQQSWDDRIHKEECKRDDERRSGTRVVETWHVGNASWYQLRQKQKRQDQISLERYRSAIAKHLEQSSVLLVQLALDSPSVITQRREKDPGMGKRLPMKAVEEECKELHKALQEDIDDFLTEVTDALGIPFLRIDNGSNGKESMGQNLREILSFVQRHYYRQVVGG